MPGNQTWAVLFDGDGTLWEYEPSMRSALELTLEELWSRLPETIGYGMTVDAMVVIRNEVAVELDGRVDDLAAVRVAAFERTLEILGIADDALTAELSASFFSHRTRLLSPRPEAFTVLSGLETFRLGYVTNGTSFPVDVGLENFFEIALRSIDHGTVKPHPGMLLSAAQHVDVAPERVIMVGDSQAEDVGAARAAGMTSILLSEEADPDLPTPHYVVPSLSAIPEILMRLSRSP